MSIFLGAIKSKLYWVIGKYPNLRITTNRPKGKFVREPYETKEAAEKGLRWEMINVLYDLGN
jgi:hypothetical protein